MRKRSGGSNPPLSAILLSENEFRGDVAQLGEHLVRNEGVGGSNPLISTIFFRGCPHPGARLRARTSATRTCEPRQDRKVAAVSKPSGVPLIILALDF